MATVLVCAGVFAASALAATRAYFVEPRELHEGWSPQGQNAFVGQSFIANVDSIYYLEWFCGQPSVPGQYVFQITQGGQYVCGGEVDVPSQGWKWLRCDNFTGNLQFTKGKEYVVKVSHSGGVKTA
jgi:hypothetical protein